MVTKVNTKEYDEAIASGAVVVDFSATWCGPCRMLAPTMEELSEEMPEVKFLNVDVDECPGVAERYSIMSIPAILVFRDGEKKAQTVGARSYDEMESWIKGSLN